MPFIHHLLYLQKGFRHFLSFFLTNKPMPFVRLQSITMDPKLLFEFSARANHLSKNSVNITKHKTNNLYLHLTDYFNRLEFKEYVLNQNGEAICLFMSSGIAIISIALKLAELDIAKRIADNLNDFVSVFDLSDPNQAINTLSNLDKRLPTLYVQYLFFISRITLYDTMPNQVHEEASLQQASTYLEKAKSIRETIDAGISSGLYDDAYNDGSDEILINLYGPNLPRIASGKKEELILAMDSYRAYLGNRDDITDLVCYSKIIRILFRLYETASLSEKIPLLCEIARLSHQSIVLAHKHQSTLTAEFYNAVATVSLYLGNPGSAEWLYKQSMVIECELKRTNGIFIQEAKLGLSFFNSNNAESAINLRNVCPT